MANFFPKQIRKRDGRVVDFDIERIATAIYKAMEESAQADRKAAGELAEEVVQRLVKKHLPRRQAGKSAAKFIPTIEEIQDIVEETLIDRGCAKVAKVYILYRQKRAEIRAEKQKILDKEEIDEVDKRFDINALRVLRSRYLRKDEKGRVIESPKQLFERVAVHAALPEILYDSRVTVKKPRISGEMIPKEEKISDEEADVLAGKLSVGKYKLNRFHVKGLHYLFIRFEKAKQTKINWKKLGEMLRGDEFFIYEKTIDEFYELMVSRLFMPNTPTLANFGSYLGMGSACFVLDIDDSIESIMDTLKNASIVFKSGGGLGYNFSKLRPEGDFIKTTGGASSGPLSFMRLFDTMTEVVKQGGIRRGANMGILNSNHPDIEKFIVAKQGNKALKNFNISVLMMPDFWELYKKNLPYPLVNPRTGKPSRYVGARFLFEKIVYSAWESAEPGILFYNRINEYNPFLKTLGPIVATNPCGELLLYPDESCNLGSLNVRAFIKTDEKEQKTFDWPALAEAVKTGVKFLDNIIDINQLPLKQIEDVTFNTRKIGLGIMGLGDLLYDLKIPFNSERGRKFMEKLMEFVNYHSKLASVELSKERGAFPYFEKSFYKEGRLPFRGFDEKKSWNFNWEKVAEQIKKSGIRNSYTTVIAPTGSISMISGCSSGIEPVYSLIFQKNVAVGSFYFINPVFEKEMLREGLFDDALIKEVIDNKGSVQKINYIPKQIKKIFVTSYDIMPEDHIRALAAFQKWVDSSVSKTNNFPAKATAEDMKKSYLLAYELGCKGVTVFRDTSIADQVLVAQLPLKEKSDDKDGLISMKDEKAGGMAVYRDPGALAKNGENGPPRLDLGEAGNRAAEDLSDFESSSGKLAKCPACRTDLINQEGCTFCPVCGWGLCL